MPRLVAEETARPLAMPRLVAEAFGRHSASVGRGGTVHWLVDARPVVAETARRWMLAHRAAGAPAHCLALVCRATVGKERRLACVRQAVGAHREAESKFLVAGRGTGPVVVRCRAQAVGTKQAGVREVAVSARPNQSATRIAARCLRGRRPPTWSLLAMARPLEAPYCRAPRPFFNSTALPHFSGAIHASVGEPVALISQQGDKGSSTVGDGCPARYCSALPRRRGHEAGDTPGGPVSCLPRRGFSSEGGEGEGCGGQGGPGEEGEAGVA